MPNDFAHDAAPIDLLTKLAFERTWGAYERTMLAWVRTATSLITFGFSVYKFFQILREEGGRSNQLIGSRVFGLILVSIGLASLAFATIRISAEYSSARRTISRPSTISRGDCGGVDLSSRHRSFERNAYTTMIVSLSPIRL